MYCHTRARQHPDLNGTPRFTKCRAERGRTLATANQQPPLGPSDGPIRTETVGDIHPGPNAFHTSLKISDRSPLVVLAGVSGTGKSELPRRYAEAFGIHFLNVAVQPRWDGPQDLFGFYDYLDRRFRATELARSLVQMDTIGPRSERGWNPPKDWSKGNRLNDQMLLVLLDEMNLARVEYYFSEFLSRLETRSGLSAKTREADTLPWGVS